MRWMLLLVFAACATEPPCVPSTCSGCYVVATLDGLTECNPGTTNRCSTGTTCRNQRCLPSDG
ncbi:MAG: hypothetical protein ABTQ32_16915 [Myxococcaceae bacterium]